MPVKISNCSNNYGPCQYPEKLHPVIITNMGETYNIGGQNEWQNIELVRQLIEITDRLLGRPAGDSLPLITFVTDRPGHDLRYAIDATKIKTELGWQQQMSFRQGLEQTVAWYLAQNLGDSAPDSEIPPTSKLKTI